MNELIVKRHDLRQVWNVRRHGGIEL